MREIRSFPIRELRAETIDGERYLSGIAAPYNSLSQDLGGYRERIRPGACARAIREKQDVRHTVNHNPSEVLGRTAAGTTVLTETGGGMAFRTKLGNRTYENDLYESVQRGDINQSSFIFTNAQNPVWSQETIDGTRVNIRELVDIDIYDVATVTYPAYTGTSTEARSRGMFPEGIPPDVRQHISADRRQARQNLRALAALPKPEMRAITNSAGVLEVVIYGIIGDYYWWGYEDCVTLARLKRAIDGAGAFTKILVRINSTGGDVFEGIGIYNLLRAQQKPVEVCVDGLAASSASIIAMAGDSIVMGRGSMMMIHQPWTILMGNATELRAEADVLDRISRSMAEIYAGRTSLAEAEILVLLEAETWLTASDAVAKGFATSVGEIADQPAAEETPESDESESDDEPAYIEPAAAGLRAFEYRNVPQHLQLRTKFAAGEHLTGDCFLHTPERRDAQTWRYPWKFGDRDKTVRALHSARERMPLDHPARPALEQRCAEYGLTAPAPSATDHEGTARLRLLALAKLSSECGPAA